MTGLDNNESTKRIGTLIVISGPSGAGKGTVCKKLLEHNPDLKLSISCTTRPMRKGELEGESYFFCSRDQFAEMVDRDEFLEYATVYEYSYGTPREYVLEQTKNGHDVLLEIDSQGAMNIMKIYPHGVFIFIIPPSMKILKERIENRALMTSETKQEIKKRLASACEEMQQAMEYDYVVINGDIDKAVKDIEIIIEAEKHKPTRNKEIITRIRSEEL